MKKRRSVRFRDTTIEYEVLRSRRHRKTVRIAVDSRGVQVTAPWNTSNNLIQAFVEDQAPWILEHINDEPQNAVPRPITMGDRLPYLGREMSVTVEAADVQAPQVRFDHWRFRIAAPKAMDEEESSQAIRDAVIGWYRERATERLDAVVERWRPRMGLGERPRILIGNQRRRWGSCAYDGTLRFNWRLAMLRPELMEYVVVHELAHLTHRNHSKHFWGLVTKFLPDAQQRRLLLRKEGLSLTL